MSNPIHKQILIGGRILFVGPENWIKGELHNDANTVWCLEGVIGEAAIRLGLQGDARYDSIGIAWEKLQDVINQRYGSDGRTSVPDYNDSYDTSFEDITRVLDEAISLCDA